MSAAALPTPSLVKPGWRWNKLEKKLPICTCRSWRPFRKAAAAPLIAKAQKCLVVDNNFTGQLGMLLKREIGFHHKYISHNRYDGLPLTVVEITEKASEVLS